MLNYVSLTLFVTIKMPKECDDITMRAVRTVPFVPIEGMTLFIPSDNDDDEDLELELSAPTYDFRESSFMCYWDNNDLIDHARGDKVTYEDRQEYQKYYASFGFKRVGYPVVNTETNTATIGG